MFVDFLLSVFREHRDRDAMVWRDQPTSYGQMLDEFERWRLRLDEESIARGSVVVIEGDISPSTVALLLALVDRGCIIVPLTASVETRKAEFIETALAEFVIRLDADDRATLERRNSGSTHPHYEVLRQRGHPGLVLFSSGSTGTCKGVVHDFRKLLAKFEVRRHDLRTIVFLLLDHIGGIDTLFYSLSNGSCIIAIEDRSPDSVCRTVERHRAEVLPVSPTFLNLLLLSQAYRRHDLSSLKYITYGAEVMPESTLARCAEIFPGVSILQKYGTTEVGTLRSRSRTSDSTWMTIGGEGYQTRVVNRILHIKADSAMIGYLNAPSPFTEDGWFDTGDEVETDGEYVRILGRQSEIINVGGEKVHPAEVENVIQEMENVAEVTVYGESNPITGHIVCARVTLLGEEPVKTFASRLKEHCRARLQNYKVPIKVLVAEGKQHGDRFKKMRLAHRRPA